MPCKALCVAAGDKVLVEEAAVDGDGDGCTVLIYQFLVLRAVQNLFVVRQFAVLRHSRLAPATVPLWYALSSQ